MGYEVKITVDEGDVRTKICKNKNEVIEFLSNHITCVIGDIVEIN